MHESSFRPRLGIKRLPLASRMFPDVAELDQLGENQNITVRLADTLFSYTHDDSR